MIKCLSLITPSKGLGPSMTLLEQGASSEILPKSVSTSNQSTKTEDPAVIKGGSLQMAGEPGVIRSSPGECGQSTLPSFLHYSPVFWKLCPMPQLSE